MTIAPKMATPKVVPMPRENCRNAVVVPITRSGTTFWAATRNTCIISPVPIPAITMLRAASRFVVPAFIRESRNMPRPRMTGPTRAFSR